MIDIKLLRENPELVKANIKKKFQDKKLVLVDEVLDLDKKNRAAIQQVESLRAERTKLSKQIGSLMSSGKKDEAQSIKAQSQKIGDEIVELEKQQETLQDEIKQRMMTIPNIIDDSVPVGKDDSENVELQRFGEPVVPDFEIPYHTDIMESFNGIDLDSARLVDGDKKGELYSVTIDDGAIFKLGHPYVIVNSEGTVYIASEPYSGPMSTEDVFSIKFNSFPTGNETGLAREPSIIRRTTRTELP